MALMELFAWLLVLAMGYWAWRSFRFGGEGPIDSGNTHSDVHG